jgi:hypothetical protein
MNSREAHTIMATTATTEEKQKMRYLFLTQLRQNIIEILNSVLLS